MEPNGQLRVDRHLLVHGQDDVFAIGDCNNIPEVKLAYLARQQATCTLENIHRKFNGQDLKDYKLSKLCLLCIPHWCGNLLFLYCPSPAVSTVDCVQISQMYYALGIIILKFLTLVPDLAGARWPQNSQ